MRTSPHYFCALLMCVFAGSIAQPRVCHAQDGRGIEQQDAEAVQLFGLGRYDEALDLFARLYSKTLHPTYLRNIGRCYQNLGQPEKAIDSFREYLRQARNLTPESRAQVDGYIAEMEALKRKAAVAQRPPERPSDSVPPTPAPAVSPAAFSKTSFPPVSLESTASGGSGLVAQPDHGRKFRIAGMATASIGVVALASGVFLSFKVKSLETDLSAEARMSRLNAPSVFRGKQSQGTALAKWQWPAYGVGVTTLVAGGLCYLAGVKIHAAAEEMTLNAQIASNEMRASLAIGF
jgi:tetratricopeptide (TPR) repeat protein